MRNLSLKFAKPSFVLLLFASLIFMLAKPEISVLAFKDSIDVFMSSILPVLFPYILASGLLVRLGGANIIGFPLRFITRFLDLDDEVSGAYATSLLGGYPAGSAALDVLYQDSKLTKNILTATLLCSNAGPMFVSATIGMVLLGSYRAGIIILVCHILSGATTAILSKIFCKKQRYEKISYMKKPAKERMSFFQILDNTIITTSVIMAKIFAFMAIFRLLGDIIFSYNKLQYITTPLSNAIARGILEIMDGSIASASLNLNIAIVLVSFIVSFSGLSVVFQSLSVMKHIPINQVHFIIGKILHGVISAVFAFIVIKIVPIEIPVYASGAQFIRTQPYGVPVFLPFMIIGLIAYLIIRQCPRIWLRF